MPRRRVLTIAPTQCFVDALAARILRDHGGDQGGDQGGDPLALSRVTILLPTRRACRSLRDAFLRAGGGGTMILPVIQPIGDVDEDELLLSPEPGLEGLGGAVGGVPLPRGMDRAPPLAACAHPVTRTPRCILHSSSSPLASVTFPGSSQPPLTPSQNSA